MNRCLTEGRRSFLERYADIESGAECERWLPVISAMADGEAAAQQLIELRPHLRNCPGCRATLRALQDSAQPLQAVLPIPLAVAALGAGDHVANLFTRVYEIVAGGLHDRAITSFTKVQTVVEATAAGKAAAIAGAAAAVAGGGYATVERSMVERRVERSTPSRPEKAPPSVRAARFPESPVRINVRKASAKVRKPDARTEFRAARVNAGPSPEFSSISRSSFNANDAAQAARVSQTSAAPPPPAEPASQAPEFTAPKEVAREFGP